MTEPAATDSLSDVATLTLVCPGALTAAALPASTSIAGYWPRGWRRADVVEHHDDDSLVPRELPHESWLRQCYGIADTDAIEAASAAIDGIALPALRLTPVHLHTGRDHLVLTDPQQMDLSIDDATVLVNAIRPLLDDTGLTLTVATPMRWYLSGPADRLPPVSDIGSRQAVGRSVDAYLSRDPMARPWRRLLNEIQMTWYDHPLNQARDARRQPAVNSLWVDGRFMAAPPARPDRLLASDDVAVQGLAQLCAAALPEPGLAGAQAWLARRDQTTSSRAGTARSLVLVARHWPWVDPLADPARFDAGWQSFGQWLVELGCTEGPPAGFDALQVVLCGDQRRVTLRIGRHQRWKFWQTVQPDTWLERLPPPEAAPASSRN